MPNARAPLPPTFLVHEVLLSIAFSAFVIVSFGALFTVASINVARIRAKDAPRPAAMPIQVKPVLDTLPLLKLGGTKRAKLPDMWQKQAPVQRFQEASAPSPKAPKTPDSLPTSPLAKPDAAPPPPDAEVAKRVDTVLLDAGPPDAAAQVQGAGSPDGVKEGTETDPLKARAVDQYRAKLQAWMNSRFQPPVGELECEELVKLTSPVSVAVSLDHHITGFSVIRPSGNAIFDQRVQQTLQRMVGEELPPPPPLYADILRSSVSTVFSGKTPSCNKKDAPPSPAPSAAPAPPAPPAAPPTEGSPP